MRLLLGQSSRRDVAGFLGGGSRGMRGWYGQLDVADEDVIQLGAILVGIWERSLMYSGKRGDIVFR